MSIRWKKYYLTFITWINIHVEALQETGPFILHTMSVHFLILEPFQRMEAYIRATREVELSVHRRIIALEIPFARKPKIWEAERVWTILCSSFIETTRARGLSLDDFAKHVYSTNGTTTKQKRCYRFKHRTKKSAAFIAPNRHTNRKTHTHKK